MNLKKISNVILISTVGTLLALQLGQLNVFADLNSSNGPVTQPVTSPVLTPTPTPGNSLSQGLVGYWKFDDDITDKSGNNNNGAPYEPAQFSYSSNIPANNPLFKKSGYFTGQTTSGFVYVLANPVLNLTDKMTVSAWVNIASWNHNEYPIIVNKSLNFLMGLRASDTKSSDLLYVGNSQGPRLWGPANITTNKWYLMVMTYDKNGGANNFKHYQDGVLTAQSTYGAIDSAPNTHLFIGSNKFNGYIDDVRIYNRVLSADEINQIYNNGNGSVL